MALATPANNFPAEELGSSRIRRLGIILGLPLADGVFVTLVLAGILDSIAGILLTGLVIFGGSAAAAVVLAQVGTRPANQLRGVALLGGALIPLAGMQAALAPSVAAMLDIALLERFAALVLVVIAVELVREDRSKWLPRPGMVVVLGLLASVRLNGGVVWGIDYGLLVRGALAAAIGVAIIAALVFVGPRIREVVEISWLRYGGGVSLVSLAIAIVTPLPETIAVAVLCSSLIVARVTRGSKLEPEISAR